MKGVVCPPPHVELFGAWTFVQPRRPLNNNKRNFMNFCLTYLYFWLLPILGTYFSTLISTKLVFHMVLKKTFYLFIKKLKKQILRSIIKYFNIDYIYFTLIYVCVCMYIYPTKFELNLTYFKRMSTIIN